MSVGRVETIRIPAGDGTPSTGRVKLFGYDVARRIGVSETAVLQAALQNRIPHERDGDGTPRFAESDIGTIRATLRGGSGPGPGPASWTNVQTIR